MLLSVPVQLLTSACPGNTGLANPRSEESVENGMEKVAGARASKTTTGSIGRILGRAGDARKRSHTSGKLIRATVPRDNLVRRSSTSAKVT